ncbi:hypothetical protein F511_12517 [Dorcoceras hygrometricum]|uniref:Phosphatidylinositol-glycan biosynthesis class F protein n=1 Tax=Dorcoceras hygrometricum TaxID=472368 RepID=A0A2Z7DIV0_9LAMI|nr:hypothetical protein F511_12517 [Dorcoceras hygrometricum]
MVSHLVVRGSYREGVSRASCRCPVMSYDYEKYLIHRTELKNLILHSYYFTCAIANALGAIVLGAPFGIQHFKKTVHWSLLMSVFTFVPAASVFGQSWNDWHRIFARNAPVGSTDFMICVPAYGAVIGAWFGAWPMPLDWERPWQDWPICVTYGAISGYLIGMMLSSGFAIFHSRQSRVKSD